jgi:hypothetical protein
MLQQHAGIYVNASNETIEDVHIESFWDGIEVGVSAVGTPGTATNVTLSNIAGSETGSSGYTTNTIHLCGNHPWDSSNSSTCASTSGMTVEDITILDAMNLNPPYTLNMTTKIAPTIIADDVTANAIASCRTNGNPPGCPTVLSTAIYALGEPDGGATTGASFSKFTSSPATPNGNYQSPPYTSYMPTWGVGSGAPNNGNTAYCSPVGAIYSQTTASGKSVYVCTPAGEWATIR